MLALVILPVLISGALFYSSKLNIRYYYQLNRLDGQLLYLKVASSGLWLMFFSVFCAFSIKYFFPSLKIVTYISGNFVIYKDPLTNRMAIWLLLLSASTMSMSVILPYLIYIKEFIQVKLLVILLSGGGIEADVLRKARHISIVKSTLPNSSLKFFFLDSVAKNKLVMVTLESRKVYVGFVEELSDPNEKRSYSEQITMQVILSGYRCEDDLSVKFVNNYSNVGTENTFVIFNREDVKIASFFDIDTYSKVNKSLANN